jgi:hypothetical protein
LVWLRATPNVGTVRKTKRDEGEGNHGEDIARFDGHGDGRRCGGSTSLNNHDRKRRSGLTVADTCAGKHSKNDGPESIHDNGTHLHFYVNGSPNDVMNAYKPALQGKSWSVTVQNSGGGGGGGGATYTGTNGNAYGVFTGGRCGSTTDVDACAWPAKPANTDCGGGHR